MGATDRRRPDTGWVALSAAMGLDGVLAAFMSIQAGRERGHILPEPTRCRRHAPLAQLDPVRRPIIKTMRRPAETAEFHSVFFRQQVQAALREQADVAVPRRGIPPGQAPVRLDVAVAEQGSEQDQALFFHQAGQAAHQGVDVRHVLEYLEGGDQVELAECLGRRAVAGERVEAGRVPALRGQQGAQGAVAAAVIEVADALAVLAEGFHDDAGVGLWTRGQVIGIDAFVILVIYMVEEILVAPAAELGRPGKAAGAAAAVIDRYARQRQKDAGRLAAILVEVDDVV